MARQRFIWPTMWEDPALGKLSDSHRVLYIGCFSLADDDGRIIGEAQFLRSRIFAYQSKSDRAVAKLRDEIAEVCKSFRVYVVDGVTYIAFLNWTEFQKPKYPKPSTLPEPPTQDSPKIPGTLPEGSPNVESAAPNSGSVGWDGLDRDGMGGVVAPVARQTDELWEILLSEIGPVATPSERGRRNKAIKELREIGATVDQVMAKCAAYRSRWPEVDLTATALVSNWSTLSNPIAKAQSAHERTLLMLEGEGRKELAS